MNNPRKLSMPHVCSCIKVVDFKPPFVLRTFDVSAGEHPVKWLLQTLSAGEGILDALWIWLDELIPGEICSPTTVSSADTGSLNAHTHNTIARIWTCLINSNGFSYHDTDITIYVTIDWDMSDTTSSHHDQ